MDVAIKVTADKFDEHFSIDEWFNFSAMSNVEMYNKMLNFVIDEDGEYVTPEQARILFKKVSKKQWPEYVAQFVRAVGDAFVNPTNGDASPTPQ